MAYETIIVDVEDHVCVITLNRPEALNALSKELLEELAEALEESQKNDKIRCIVITGSEKAFAAGADIKMMQDKNFSEVFLEDLFTSDSDRISRIRKPIIAAVSGYALGGGCELAMMCDFIICSDTAKFGQPEINLGTIPAAGGTQRLVKSVGKSKAMELVLSGSTINAEEALNYGLVSKVVPLEDLDKETINLAENIAKKSLPILILAKEAILRSFESTLSEGMINERRLFQSTFELEDRKEGMTAFLEKRLPKFKNE